MTRSELLALWNSDPTITVSKLRGLAKVTQEQIYIELEMAGVPRWQQIERGKAIKANKMRMAMEGRAKNGTRKTGYSVVSRTLPRCPRCELLTADGGLCCWCQEDMIRVGGG